MGSGRLGYTSSIVKRKQLKKRTELTDEELLADAMREAEKWKARLHNSNNTVIH